MLFEKVRDPHALALDDGVRRRSFAELADRSTRVARFLRDEAGVRPGEHVALLMENRVEIVEVLLGAILAGVWITPINWHLRDDEIGYVVADCGARVLFASPHYEETAARVADAAGRGTAVVLAGEGLDAALARASDANSTRAPESATT